MLKKLGLFVSTIIVAAGSGRRFGGKKQFYRLKGKPVVLWSIEKFLPVSDEIILLLPSEDVRRFKKKWGASYPSLKVFTGGAERFLSVKSGLSQVSGRAQIICIHDGARPLIAGVDILRAISAAEKYGGAICAAKASDTIKLSGRLDFIEKTLDRNRIYLAQTPQVFRREVILDAYKRTTGIKPTDDASLVEKIKGKVKLIAVTSPNLKITDKSDIIVAEQLLKLTKKQ